MNILVIGSGGREHSLCWKIRKSPKCKELYCIPGNGGIDQVAECIDIDPSNQEKILDFCEKKNISLVVIGPEIYLEQGLSDYLLKRNIKVFGPSKNAAKLETSKIFSKNFLKKHSIPTANYNEFYNYESSVRFIRKNKPPFVIKVDGLASGKGVIICNSIKESEKTIEDIFINNKFGKAGKSILIEEFLEGYEISYFAFFDKNDFLPFGYALDHKRAKNYDKGLNTGGMGAFSPSKKVTAKMENSIIRSIVEPTKKALAKDKIIYRGIIFFGLMITKDGPKVIEYNTRFGDPECQVLMRLCESDILELLYATSDDKLDKKKVVISNEYCICVILASIGYPEKYKNNIKIKDLEKKDIKEKIHIFHSGTIKKKESIYSNGGRVLSITSKNISFDKARSDAYETLKEIDWINGFYRDDIGIKNYE